MAASTTLPPPGASDVVLVIDLSGYVFRAWHAIQTPMSSPSGEPTHATLGTLNMIQRLVLDQKPQRLLVAMDSRTPSFRKLEYPGYKANRPPAPPDLAQQMLRSRELAEAYGMTIVQRDGVEADDVIATVVRQARAKALRVIVVSSDKDLMQLVGDDVVLWDTMRNKVYGTAEVVEKLGVPPAQIRDFLALTGDSSDNVPGVPHVGPKTAAELLAKFGSLEALYAGLDTLDKKKVKLRENLALHEADARISQRLVTLKDDVDLGLDVSDVGPARADVPRLRALFSELGFERLLAGLERSTPGVSTPARPSPTASAPASARPKAILVDEVGLRAFAERAHGAAAIALRLETTSAEAMRGDVIGIAFATPAESVYAPIGHLRLDLPPQVSLAAVSDALRGIFAPGGPRRLAHDGKREDVLLRRLGLFAPAVGFDTMLAAYVLDPESRGGLVDLARGELGLDLPLHAGLVTKERGKAIALEQADCNDLAAVAGAWAGATLDLGARLGRRIEEEGLGELLEALELPLADALADMELHGVRVDVAALRAIGTLVDAKLLELEAKAHAIAGKTFNVASPRQLETLLFDDLGLKPGKRTKTSRSTDAEVLEALAEEHELPGVILEHRQLAKLRGTYIEALPALVNPRSGRIHTTYAQAVAATGRISSIDPNLQNIPIKSEVGRAIRSAFVAPPGDVILSADYSQIELRVLAHLSRDPVLLDAFTTGEDVHARTAMEIFGKTRDALTADDRRAAKTINFGVIYGMGESALAKRLGIPRKDAARFIEAYFARYSGVRTFFDGIVQGARASGFVTTLRGRRRFVPDLSSANRSVRLAAERVAQNTPIQGSAADILKLAMIALREPGEGARMILTVHDELVLEVAEANAARLGERVRAAMAGVVTLAVPLVVDVGWGRTWAEAKA